MKNCDSKMIKRSRMHLHVVLALTALGSQASSSWAAEAEPAVVAAIPTAAATGDNTALDAEAIKARVVISGNAVANRAPVQSSLKATQPQSIITATFIEQSVTPLADYNAVSRIAPSVGAGVSPNGPGLAETKVTLRGFQDGEYNMTYDGIPFGDTNDPTHHSTSYFPARIIGGMVIERGPGNAGNLGQATFGGSVNLYSKELSADFAFSPYATYGTWNTLMKGFQIDSGHISNWGDANMMFNASRLSTDGYLTYNAVSEENYQFKLKKNFSDTTSLTVFSTYNTITSYTPDKAGVTLSQVAQFGKNYSLNNDPASQNYWGYNFNHKTTDFDYIKLESDILGWKISNQLYTYAYTNDTYSGQDASGATANGTKAGAKGNTNVPGYNKLNAYRVKGDILRADKEVALGWLRTGLWYEVSNSNRHTYDLDWTLGKPNPKEASAPLNVSYEQRSSWKQYQPFVEFEWLAMPDLRITPGLKYLHFTREVDAAVNQGTRIPTQASETYTSTLPFLTANYQFDSKNAAYAQYAKGFLVPALSVFYVNNPGLSAPQPQTSSNYQLGWVHQSSNLALDADMYYIDFNNKLASSGSGNDLVYFNQGGVVYKGVEAAATYYLGQGVSIHWNGSLNSAKSKSTQLQIAKVPASTTALGLLYKLNGVFSSLILKRVGEQYAQDGEPAAYKISSYNTVDLTAGYQWRQAGAVVKNVKLQIGVNNLLNKQDVLSISASSKGSQFDQYTFAPPRSWNLSLSLDF
ncbi:TonB-dependent receptor [Undibacterium rugosum]|uniref:TonB-dependent receptor n=1 Tax=Undibacterium rugosum TaxID=2762291 RepID=UPI001B81EC0A|nr:TonB-dependent receptor [Undibacterium rugosum]MBR7777002.1 TonB-dependent receptor [Undibacterium rugosum]